MVDSNIFKDVKSKGKRKSKDLNRKGEEKVGTDMDAFLDIQVSVHHTEDVIISVNVYVSTNKCKR